MMTVWIWSLPILFMLHDFEEIITISAWKNKYHTALQNAKRKPFAHFTSTASGSVSVLIEFVLLTLATLAATLFGWYAIWYAFYVALLVHYFIHYAMSIAFRHYTPGLMTAALFMPISAYILFCARVLLLEIPLRTTVLTFAGLFILIVPFFKWLTGHIAVFNSLLERYAKR